MSARSVSFLPRSPFISNTYLSGVSCQHYQFRTFAALYGPRLAQEIVHKKTPLRREAHSTVPLHLPKQSRG